MKSFFPDTSGAARGGGEPAESSPTEALPAAEATQAADPTPVTGWRRSLQPKSGAAPGSWLAGAAEQPAEASDNPELPGADEEPFIPKSKYVMGRSTKVLACVVLVAAGMFTGSAIQKQIDAGTRGSRSNFGNFQGPGAGTGTGSGNFSPGQGRRGGGTAGGAAGGGTAGGAGAGGQGGAATPSAGQ
ncbi:hypothetical protein SAMN04487914_13130 [Arthrobacter sp. ok909]|uniref:hypothetical protein n=1 Tax=Arthrobacter sp. ok909 TaxID=1761746 RepID=UPI0008920F53|nr:hypothetical protein [Arthrobacter sp. ok909]SDP73138.1 hypothetical protein SAMN04487914_13130 [Arthrobacter sp. ok909]